MPQPTALIPCQASRIRLLIALVAVVAVQPATAQDDDLAKARAAAMTLAKPLYKDFEDAHKTWRRKDAEFKAILNSGPKRGASDNQKLNDGIKHYLYMMTDPAITLPELIKQRDRFLNMIDTAGRTINNPSQQTKHRENVFSATSDVCVTLLDGNLYVRYQAVTILGSMNASSRPAVPYTGSRRALIQIAGDNKQFLGIRLLALRGLNRMVQYASIPAPDEADYLSIVGSELMRDGLPSGYYFELARFLRHINVTFEVRGQQRPIGVMGALHSMTDRRRSWRARCAAARAIGTTGDGSPTVRWQVLAWKVAQFAHEAGTEFERQRVAGGAGGNGANVMAAEELFDVFLALHHLDKPGAAKRKGIINRTTDPAATAAYKAVLPLVEGSIRQGAIPAKALGDLDAWVKGNVPAQLLYHNKAPAIGKPAANAKANEPPGERQASTNGGAP